MLRIGLLGAARITPRALLEPAADRTDVRIVAVGARTEAAAAAFARTHAITHASDRASLIARDDIDLVYVATPVSDHAEWSIRALEAGKHVLCEKPFALSLTEARAVQGAAARTGRRVIEAAHYRYHPLVATLLDLLAQNAIGAIDRVEAEFAVPVRDTAEEIRRIPALGGGCFRDIGYYPLHLVRTLFGPPLVRAARATWRGGVDESIEADLSWPGGLDGWIRGGMAMDEKPRAWARLHGAHGDIEVRNFVAPQMGGHLKITRDGAVSELPVTTRATFAFQLDAVIAALAAGPALTEGEDILAQQGALDAVYAAAGPAPKA